MPGVEFRIERRRSTSSQLEGGDAEHPLDAQWTDRPGIHAGGLEHRRQSVGLRQCDRVAIDARDVEKDLTAAGRRHQGKAANTASAAARSSATSGPILWPVRQGRITPQAASRPSRTSARPICPRAAIQARRKASRGAGNTVASSAAMAANATSASGTNSRRRGRRCDRAAVADIGIGQHSPISCSCPAAPQRRRGRWCARPHARPRRSRCAAHGRGRPGHDV